MDKGMIVILVLIGLVLGLALVGSDLINPLQGRAVSEDQADKREYMRPVNEAIAQATKQSIEIAEAYEPTRQAITAKEEEARSNERAVAAQQNEKAEREMKLVIVVTICGAFLIIVTLAAMILYKMAVTRLQPPAANDRFDMPLIPTTGGPRRPAAPVEPNPVEALNRRALSGRCDGHSHRSPGFREAGRAAEDNGEARYPSNNY